jgi:hypothetical protein
MSFVVLYLPFFRQWLITHLLSAFLPFQHLFTDSSCGDYLIAPPPFSGSLSVFPPLLLCASFSSLFIIQYSFCWGGESVSQGAMLVYPRGDWGVPHDIWCSPTWSA